MHLRGHRHHRPSQLQRPEERVPGQHQREPADIALLGAARPACLFRGAGIHQEAGTAGDLSGPLLPGTLQRRLRRTPAGDRGGRL